MPFESMQGTFPSTSGLSVEPRMASVLQVMSLREAKLNKLPIPALITVTAEEVRQASQKSYQIVAINL